MNRSLRAILVENGEARSMAPSDALGVAALAARVHGLAYAGPDGSAFDADALAARIAQGLARAALVTDAGGRVAAFAALAETAPGTLAVGAVAVEGDIAARLWGAVAAEARRAGARKVVLEEAHGGPLGAVASLAARGAPAAVSSWFTLAPDGATRLVRVALLDPRPLAVRLPAKRGELLRRVLAAHDAPRDEAGPASVSALDAGPTAPAGAPAPPARAAIEVGVSAERRLGRLRVTALGADALAELKRLAEELKRGRLDGVEVRVPLATEEGAALVDALESSGFALAGLDPDVDGRDEAVLLALPERRIDARGAAPRGDTVAEAIAATLGEGLVRAAGGDPASSAPAPPAIPPLEMIEFARLAGQKQLVAGISHEINNPLNIILGTTYVLKSRLREGNADDAVARITSIEEEVARIAKVLEGLRRFAQPEANGRARVEVARPIDEALALTDGEARESGIELRRDIAAGLPLVRANAAEVAQVVFQLVKNAIEASEPGRPIDVEARLEGGGVRVAVRDRGRGIAAENMRRVFDPFYTTKQTGIGSGLGLSIARAIVEAHGGRLKLESRVGEGTVASFDLAATREKQEKHERHAPRFEADDAPTEARSR